MSDDDEAAEARAALARNLIKARHKRYMSQQDLADAAGISQQRVSIIELGQENVTLRTVGALARALGVTVEELFRRSGKM